MTMVVMCHVWLVTYLFFSLLDLVTFHIKDAAAQTQNKWKDVKDLDRCNWPKPFTCIAANGWCFGHDEYCDRVTGRVYSCLPKDEQAALMFCQQKVGNVSALPDPQCSQACNFRFNGTVFDGQDNCTPKGLHFCPQAYGSQCYEDDEYCDTLNKKVQDCLPTDDIEALSFCRRNLENISAFPHPHCLHACNFRFNRTSFFVEVSSHVKECNWGYGTVVAIVIPVFLGIVAIALILYAIHIFKSKGRRKSSANIELGATTANRNSNQESMPLLKTNRGTQNTHDRETMTEELNPSQVSDGNDGDVSQSLSSMDSTEEQMAMNMDGLNEGQGANTKRDSRSDQNNTHLCKPEIRSSTALVNANSSRPEVSNKGMHTLGCRSVSKSKIDNLSETSGLDHGSLHLSEQNLRSSPEKTITSMAEDYTIHRSERLAAACSDFYSSLPQCTTNCTSEENVQHGGKQIRKLGQGDTDNPRLKNPTTSRENQGIDTTNSRPKNSTIFRENQYMDTANSRPKNPTTSRENQGIDTTNSRPKHPTTSRENQGTNLKSGHKANHLDDSSTSTRSEHTNQASYERDKTCRLGDALSRAECGESDSARSEFITLADTERTKKHKPRDKPPKFGNGYRNREGAEQISPSKAIGPTELMSDYPASASGAELAAAPKLEDIVITIPDRTSTPIEEHTEDPNVLSKTSPTLGCATTIKTEQTPAPEKECFTAPRRKDMASPRQEHAPNPREEHTMDPMTDDNRAEQTATCLRVTDMARAKHTNTLGADHVTTPGLENTTSTRAGKTTIRHRAEQWHNTGMRPGPNDQPTTSSNVTSSTNNMVRQQPSPSVHINVEKVRKAGCLAGSAINSANHKSAGSSEALYANNATPSQTCGSTEHHGRVRAETPNSSLDSSGTEELANTGMQDQTPIDNGDAENLSLKLKSSADPQGASPNSHLTVSVVEDIEGCHDNFDNEQATDDANSSINSSSLADTDNNAGAPDNKDAENDLQGSLKRLQDLGNSSADDAGVSQRNVTEDFTQKDDGVDGE